MNEAEEINVLNEVLRRACANGYRLVSAVRPARKITVESYYPDKDWLQFSVSDGVNTSMTYTHLPQLLYEQEFARSLFGDFWETHLNLLTSSKNKIAYLKEYLLQQKTL